ncbi:MAG: hypothetical protein KF893_03605 [Caldilineaceae bacterium]|nr:hypothetical protein [Caldilineaceae bacterium]
MNTEVKRIAYEEFANNLSSVLDRVIHENAVVVVETADGELALLRSLAPEELSTKSEADYAAFRSAAGSWAECPQMLSDWVEFGLAVSLINYGEVYEGIYFSQKPDQQQADFTRHFQPIPGLLLYDFGTQQR